MIRKYDGEWVPKENLVIDRASFIAWTQGVLLERDARGKVFIGDKAEHWEAEEALNRGEIVYLSRGGKRVSYLQKTGKGIEEFLVVQDIVVKSDWSSG